MSADALSDLLRAVRLSGSLFFRVALSAPYSVVAMESGALDRTFSAEAEHVMPYHLVTTGSMWVEVDHEAPLQLHEKDILVLPRGTRHVLTDRPGRTAVLARNLMHTVSGSPPTLVHGGGGARAEALCGFLRCSGASFGMLRAALPSVLVLRDSPRTAWLGSTLQRALAESYGADPGAQVLAQRLSETLFVEVVQDLLVGSPELAGRLRALQDPVVSQALALMHDGVAESWTVEELGRRVGASRSTLAQRFVDAVGLSPIKYLAALRMECAADRMRDTEQSIAEIAQAVGYDSEASFNRAFKRHVGEPPGAWRRSRQDSQGPRGA